MMKVQRQHLEPIVRNRCQIAGLLLGGTMLMSCSSANPVDPAVRPIVERLEQTPAPPRWNFSYLPISASPYVACLGGFDEVEGAIDTTSGVVTLKPNREAPPILVTETSFMVRTESQGWDEVRIFEGDLRSLLTPRIGEVLAGFVADGIKIPDPKMTAIAAVEIAESVRLAETPLGLTGDSFTVVMDPKKFVDGLQVDEAAPREDDLQKIPTITVTVGLGGLVSGLVVQTPTSSSSTESGGYALSIDYRNTPTITLPSPGEIRITSLDEFDYPTPIESCAFGN